MRRRAKCGRGRDRAIKWEEEDRKRDEERGMRAGKRRIGNMMVMWSKRMSAVKWEVGRRNLCDTSVHCALEKNYFLNFKCTNTYLLVTLM